MAAIEKHGKAWKAITAAEQDALLQEASTAEPANRSYGTPFQNLKGWIAGAYYSSEPGMRELGLDGQRVPRRAARVHASGGALGVGANWGLRATCGGRI